MPGAMQEANRSFPQGLDAKHTRIEAFKEVATHGDCNASVTVLT